MGSADWKNPLTKLTVACEKICRMPDLNKMGRKPGESSAPAEVIRQGVDVMKPSILLIQLISMILPLLIPAAVESWPRWL